MDPLIEEELIAEEEPATMINPIIFVVQFLSSYGWYVLGAFVGLAYLYQRLRPNLDKWRQAREDAEYHKDPDKALSRAEAVERARRLQQERLEAESARALQLQREREEKKRQETLERLKKYGTAAGGQRLGAEDDYLPLSGGGSTSSYKPPKRSACSGGGCGR